MANPKIIPILGKTIKGVVIKRNTKSGSPHEQLLLIFSDDTHYEFYTTNSPIFPTSKFQSGGLEGVRRFMSPVMEIIYGALLDDDGNVNVMED